MSERCVGAPALSAGRFISQKGGIVEEIMMNTEPPNPRPHANFQFFSVNRVFEKEIDGFRSWECRNRHHMDLLYILNFSNPKKVHSKKIHVVFYDCLMF